MAVTGEVGYSSAGRTPVRMSYEPVAPGDYNLTLLGKSVEIKGKPEPGKLPYVNLAFTAAGTGGEHGKDKRVYHKLFLNLEPSPKTGTPIVDQANQILGLAKALGVELSFGADAILKKDRALDDGSMQRVSILDPRKVVEWLQGFDGVTVKAHVKVRKGNKEYPNDQNEIAYFHEADGPREEEDEDEEEYDEEDEDLEDEDEEEEAPAPPKKNGKAKAAKRR